MFASKKWASIFMNYCYSLSLLFIITTINLPTTFADENNGTFMYFFAYPDRNGNCPADVYSKYHIYNTPFLQLGQIMSYGGILFTVAVYGVRSAFGWRLTFFLDDLVIIFFGFSPVVPFYIIGQVCGRITDKSFRDSFIFIIMTCWGIIGWIIVSIIHDFNYRYDLSANRKYYLKIVTAVIHLICAVSILATDIFSTYYDSSIGTNSVYDILNVNFLSYFANAIYLIMSIYLICHFWQHESIKHGDLNPTGAVHFFPLRMYFMTLFLSVIQVFFAYAYVCSLEIINSVFNFIVGMVSTRAIASFFSNKRIVYGYLMEVDDDRDLGATDEGRVDSDAKELRASHSILKRFLAFMLFFNYANGNFTWKASMVGYVDKEQIFFISERSSLKIRCRKIKYKNKENKENDCYLHRSILKIEKDRIDIEEYKKIDTLKKLEELKNEKGGMTSLEKEEEEEEEEIEAVTIKKLNALKIKKNEIETVFKLFGRGKIISESGKKVIYRRWEATLNIEYDKMYLIQQVEIFRSKAANLKSKGIEGSAEMHWSRSIVSYEDEEENCTASDGELRIIIEDDKNLNCKWELEVRDDNKWRLRIKDNKNFLNDDEWRLKPEDLESGEWKLKLRDDKAYLVHRKRIGECKSLNIKNEEIVKLNRKVNLNCKWDLKNDGTKKLMYVHKEVINNREISKIIDMNNLNFIKLILEGDSRVRIKENKIHLEYKVKVLENADKYDELLSAENSILEEEISDSVSQSDETATEYDNKRMWSNRDQSCGLVTEDKFFGWRAKNSTGNNFITRSCWNAILRKNRTDIYLDHEVQHKETIHMSVEGNKLINLGYDPKDNNNDRDIIKLTYDKIIYMEDFSKNFRSLTINKVFEIKKSDDGRSLEKLDKNNNIFTSWFCNNDELTIKTGNGDGNEIKFIKKCWRWSDRKPRYCIMDNNKSDCPRDNIIKIRIYADAIVRVTNTDNEMKRIVLEHGGKLEIKIKDDGSVKIVLFKKVQLNEYGLLRIQEGCVTHVEKPKDKGFVDLTKHGFLNFLIYNHKKQVKKLREQKEIEQAVGCVKQI